YGCTTCIGNSGPVDEPIAAAVKDGDLVVASVLSEIAAAVKDGDLVVASVLSGNRNFEGRVNPIVKANYLMSPPLVVAYAIAGTIDIDLSTEPLGVGSDGAPVFLRDLWPSPKEVAEAVRTHVRREQFVEKYAHVLD